MLKKIITLDGVIFIIEGPKIALKAIEREDLYQLKEWRNLPSFRMCFREFREINNPMQMIWYENQVLNDPNFLMFSIKFKETDELLGSCGLCNINWVHRQAEISLMIGWNSSYIDDQGYAEEVSKLLINYAFNEINLNKVWAEVFEIDKKKRALFDKIGFVLDGTLREHYYYGGEWWDSYILSLLKKDYCNKMKDSFNKKIQNDAH